MRIHTKTSWDIATWQVLEDQYYEYYGPVEMCKHDQAKNNALDFQNRQLALQQKAFDAQQANMNSVKSALGKYLTGDIGFNPEQLALLQSQFMGNNATNFDSARSGVMGALASRGAGLGNRPVGGDFVRGLSGLYGQQASSLSSGLANIKLADLQQALTNKFNTASLYNGQAATLNGGIGAFTQGAVGGLDAYTKAATMPSFWDTFGQSFAGNLGSGLGSGLTGGLGKVSKGYA